MKSRIWVLSCMIVVIVLPLLAYKDVWGGSIMRTDLVLDGKACGGSLVLTRTRNRNQEYVSIHTSVGESAQSVAKRLADAINEEDPFKIYRAIKADGNRLIQLPGAIGNYVLAGTERGLGIPEPPLFLSCAYDESADVINIRWVNPASGYDWILLKCYGRAFNNHVCSERLAGDAQTYTIQKGASHKNDLAVRVMGIRKGMPSNQGAVQMTKCGQEETYGIPFSGGLAPNWLGWSTAAAVADAALEQGEKYPKSYMCDPAASGLLTKPFYQVIKAGVGGAPVGVWRKFFGVTPEHTYRVSGCLSTLEMDSAKGDWSLSLHAAYNAPGGKDLAPKQLAGEEPLPSGKKATPEAAIDLYGPGNTTREGWRLVFTGDQRPMEVENSHVTLPAGADTLTVWVRFTSADPNGKVGFSGVRLEDITRCPDIRRPDAIRIEERDEEDFLIACRSKLKRAGVLK